MRRSWKGLSEDGGLSDSSSSIAVSETGTDATAGLAVVFVDGFSVVPHPNEAAMSRTLKERTCNDFRIIETPGISNRAPPLARVITVLLQRCETESRCGFARGRLGT
jgi:hypothetical protein